MTTTDANGIVLYETTDPVSPLQTLLNLGQASVSSAITGAKTIVCTSTTRPGSPADGQLIEEYDTKAFGMWNATAGKWYIFDTQKQAFSGAIDVYGGGLITPGNGSVTSTFFRRGMVVDVEYMFHRNTTTGIPSGTSKQLGLRVPTGYLIGSIWTSSVIAPIGQFRMTSVTPSGVAHGQVVIAQALSNAYAYMLTTNSTGGTGLSMDVYITSDALGSGAGNLLTATFSYTASSIP